MKYRKASSVLCPKCAAPALTWADALLIWLFARRPRDEFSTFCNHCRFRVTLRRSSDGRLVVR